MCIPCLDPMKHPADLNTTDLDTNKGLVILIIVLALLCLASGELARPNTVQSSFPHLWHLALKSPILANMAT